MRRSLWLFLLVTAIILVVGYIVFVRFVRQGPSDESLPRENLTQMDDQRGQSFDQVLSTSDFKVVIEEIEGLVEYRKPDNQWMTVQAGDNLVETDSLKTAKNSWAELKTNTESRLRLDQSSELELENTSNKITKFCLKKGRVSVDHRPSGPQWIQVQSGPSQAVAETRDGSFSVMKVADVVSVSATRGTVKLTAKKKSVTLKPGLQSKVLPREEPRTPAPIPTSILLEIAKPRKRVLAKRFIVLTGKVSVGAEVRVNQVLANTDRRGNFRARVPLSLGRNKLVATTMDVAGNLKTVNLGFVFVRPRANVKDIQVQWE